MFAGVVGTSGNRREYSVIGDSVNLSARMMGTACKSADHRIMVSEETVKSTEGKVSYEFYKCYLFKGKSKELPIYLPLEYSDE